MQKNVAGQIWTVFAYDSTTNLPVTGDAVNITGNLYLDGSVNAIDDTNPTEKEDGYYVFDITQAESNADHLMMAAESSTANVQVIGVPGALYTRPPNFIALGIESDGDLTKVNLVATTTVNSDMRGTDGANTVVPDAAGVAPTATEIVDEWESQSQADPTGFHINAMEWLSTALPAPNVAGRPVVSGGYDGGAVWINTLIANTNTVDHVDGTIENPVSTIAAATTIAASLGMKKFALMPGSSITLAQAYDNYIFDACHATIALGGFSVNNSVFIGAVITGNDDGSNASHTQYFDCVFTNSTLGQFVFTRCYFLGTTTLAEAGNYFMHQCFSGVPGGSTPNLDFGSGLDASGVSVRDYSGGIEIENMGAGSGTYNMSLEGNGQLIINANCSATSILKLRGNFNITDNADGAVLVQRDDDSIGINRNSALIESQRGFHTVQGKVFYVDPVNGDTHAVGNRGGKLDPYSLVQDCHDNAVTDSEHDCIILVSGAAAGVTTLTEDVTISKRYLMIRGPGRDFIWTRSGAGDTISITADGVELSGFQLETAGTGSGNGIQVTDADFHRIHHVWVNDTRGDGINLLRAENCQIHDNHFFQTGQSGSGQGIHVVGTAGSSNNNRIEDNHFVDVSGDAVKIEDGSTLKTCVCRNDIEGSTGWGINIGASSTDAFVADNRLGNNASGDITDSGTTTVLYNNGDYDAILITIAGDVENLDGDAMRGTDNANIVIPDVSGTAAVLHATTDALIGGLNDPTAAVIATAVMAETVDGGLDLQEALVVLLALATAKEVAVAGNVYTYKDQAGVTKVTITFGAASSTAVIA